MVEPVLLPQFWYMRIDKWPAIIEENALSNAKPKKDITRTGHGSFTDSLESHYMDPFSVALVEGSICFLEMVS